MEERIGEAFELGERLTVLGAQLRPGEAAPDFALDTFDSAAGAIHSVRLGDTAGRVRLLNVVNSLDTPVCHLETHRWEDLRQDLPAGAVVYTISMDLPFAQARWQDAEHVTHQALSAHKSEQFGRDYGVLLKEWRLLQRAVFVVDGAGRITYAEYVPDQMAEPSYALAKRVYGNMAAAGHYQHRLAADLERGGAPQVPRISTGQALACGIVKEGVSTMPALSLRAEPLVTVSAAAAVSGGEQENRRLGLRAEPLDEMAQQASETRVRMLRCTDRRHEGFWTPKFSAPARPMMKTAGWREHRHGIRGGKME